MIQRSKIQQLARERQFVRFRRRFEDASIRGYILDIGPRFFLLALVSDRLWFDGFECFRIGDIRDLKPDPHAEFAVAALRKRREGRPKKPRISLASIEDILLSATKAFPLVTIHREQVRPDTCHIGRVTGIARGQVSLLEIDPDAIWDTTPRRYRLTEITRVNFGGDYEDALHIVGGAPA
jgi:hypothetical protein